MTCPSFNGGAEGAGVSHALGSVDCHVDAAVAGAYGRLFGHGGAFAAVLTALLTLYVAWTALGLMTGRTRLTLSGLGPRVLAIGLVLTFATSWPAYQTLAYGFLVGGPEEIVRQLSGPGAGAHAFAGKLDAVFDRFADIAKALGDEAPGASKALGAMAGPQMAAALVWLSGIMLLLGTAGALVLTRIVLALLLALGPVFVVLALFKTTRGLFEGWLRTAVMFAVAPLFTVLAGSGALALLAPLVDVIAEDPAAAVADLRPVLELFMGAVVYLGLMAMLLWTSGGLVAGWRPFGASEADSVARGAAAPAPMGEVATTALATPASTSDARTQQLAAALGREAATAAAAAQVRVEQVAEAPRAAALFPTPAATTPPSTSPAAPSSSPDRVRGLGQSFRPAASPNPTRLSGAVG